MDIHLGNCLDILPTLEEASIDCIITDPPYFLSNGGMTCQSGKMVSVDKGEWDRKASTEDFLNFNRLWISEASRIVKPGGTMWISGTMHNIYDIGHILSSMDDFKLLNNITWVKPSPPPNLSCRMFTHSTETILWVRKGVKSKHFFNYPLMKTMNGGKQMKDVWTVGRPRKAEKAFGKHPTQKPEALIQRMVEAATEPGDVVLDMFCGSGTTGVVCAQTGRRFIGIEQNPEYHGIAVERATNAQTSIPIT